MKKHGFSGALFVLLVFFTPVSGLKADVWTLDACIEKALSNNPEIKIKREELNQTSLDERLNRRLGGITVDTEVSYGRVSEVMRITMPGKTISFGDENTCDAGLIVTKPLYSGYRFREYRQPVHLDGIPLNERG